MLSRPQFSLRSLLFVTMVVCLAAAATTPPPNPRRTPSIAADGGADGGWGWHGFGFGLRAQAGLRLALCVIFPALFTAGALRRQGYFRTFCSAALLPAFFPILLLCISAWMGSTLAFQKGRVDGVIEAIGMASYSLRRDIGVLWAFVPCIGFSCVIFHWFLKLGNDGRVLSGQQVAARLLVVVLAAVCFATAMIALPRSEQQLSLVARMPVRLILCFLFPAALSAGAVQGRRYCQSFCACGLLPALVPLVLVYPAIVWDPNDRGYWEPSQLFHWRNFIVTMWALAPCFGLACVFFHWLFQLGEAWENGDDRREQPGKQNAKAQ